jgi:hypothetical protein
MPTQLLVGPCALSGMKTIVSSSSGTAALFVRKPD